MQRTPRSAPTRSEWKQQAPRTRKLANAAIVGLGALLVAGLGLMVVQDQETDARAEVSYTPPSAPASLGAPEVHFTPMSDAVRRLNDDAQPWTMTVLGDSTGNEETEWVQLVVRQLAEQTGRPAVIYTWSVEGKACSDKTEISGEGAPIIVWNASASGQNADYTKHFISKMVPEPSDVVIINHGHNQTTTEGASTGIKYLASWVKMAWAKAPALAVTLQNPRVDSDASRQDAVVGQLREDYADRDDVTTIDAYAAFKDHGDLASLLREDGFHPNDSGEQVWADAVRSALKLDSVGA